MKKQKPDSKNSLINKEFDDMAAITQHFVKTKKQAEQMITYDMDSRGLTRRQAIVELHCDGVFLSRLK